MSLFNIMAWLAFPLGLFCKPLRHLINPPTFTLLSLLLGLRPVNGVKTDTLRAPLVKKNLYTDFGQIRLESTFKYD